MPTDAAPPRSRARFTFQGNLRETRHGWLRLTPAYSVHLVRELLQERARSRRPVLDPFCGTGTTLLACRELGIECDTVDLNPFLVWLARAKAAHYPPAAIDAARAALTPMAAAARRRGPAPWLPPIYRIDRWWSAPTAAALARAWAALQQQDALRARPRDLAQLAFCRALIDTARVSFGHQSMSFRRSAAPRTTPSAEAARVAAALELAIESVTAAATSSRVQRVRHRVLRADARDLDRALGGRRYGTVVTSPPYPNRMSYIRELRPYMYWLGYLSDRSAAGQLDWRLIGGTWGSATSRLLHWAPDEHVLVPFPSLGELAARIAHRSTVLSRYVLRYFQDMATHVRSLRRVLARGARLHYVVGNSKFYDVLVPAQDVFAALFENAGLRRVRVRELRRRTSKTELREYLVSATRP